MKTTKRQARRLPLPEDAILVLKLDTGQALPLDRQPDEEPMLGVPGDVPRRIYVGHGFKVVITRSNHAEFGQLLHASISHASGQLPPWYVMKALKRAVFPDNVAAMLPMPEMSAYTNIAEALHIVQVPGPWGHL